MNRPLRWASEPCLYPHFSSRPCHLAWQERQFDGLETISRHHPPPASLSGRSASFGLRPETDSPTARGGRGLGALPQLISLALQTGPPACRAGRGNSDLPVKTRFAGPPHRFPQIVTALSILDFVSTHGGQARPRNVHNRGRKRPVTLAVSIPAF